MIVRTSKLSDGELLELLAKLFELFPAGKASASIGEGVTWEFEDVDDVRGCSLKRASKNVQSFTFQCQTREADTVLFHRGIVGPEQITGQGAHSAFSSPAPSAYFDELAFFPPRSRSGHYQPLTDDQRIAVSELLDAYAAPTDTSSDDEARQLSKVVSKQINDLRKVNLRMTEGLAEARKKDEEAFRERQSELDSAFKTRLEELAEKEADLQRRRAELNDREPQHERRRLREHLTDRLQKTIAEPPKESTAREWWSNVLYLAVGAIFVTISIMITLNTDAAAEAGSAAFWARSLKGLASGAAGAAFAWAGLAGLKSSARAARTYEQQMQRYAFDMDRASWIVETILQMNAIEKAQVPEEWLEAVCRDLFLVTGSKRDDARSLESFAALFDATARAKIGTSGIDFEIDRKGARKLAQE
jgi:hypothetical protein